MKLFRLHIRPTGGDASREETFAYCIRNGIAGVGWRTSSNTSTSNWDTYFYEASSEHDDLSTCLYIKNEVCAGSLIWTRDTMGIYYLAKVISGWEYYTSDESRERDIDIANIVRCEYQQIHIDEVPGKVIACFRPARTIQQISDETAKLYSRYIWNKKSCCDDFKLYVPEKGLTVFSMLDAEETEDLVCLYLQERGWFVVPNSRKADSMTYEYLLVDPKHNQKAQVQVKTGWTPLNISEYASAETRVFLFQSNGIYHDAQSDNVTCIAPEEMEAFLQTAMVWLPRRYQNRYEMLEALKHRSSL